MHCDVNGGRKMRIDSEVQRASGVFGKQQCNNKTSTAENSAFPQSSKKVYLKTDDMLFSGGNGTGLSFYIKYAEESTEENPVVIAKGVDENGKEFEQKININDINLRNASFVEMSALEAHCNVDRGNSLTSFPQETGRMGLNDRCDLVSSFEKVIQDMKKLGKYDLQMFYMRSMNTYLNLAKNKKA
jgi:TFIIF-interacting CTD phosphatase-like protein